MNFDWSRIGQGDILLGQPVMLASKVLLPSVVAGP